MTEQTLALPDSWTPLRRHEEQQRLWDSRARFKVVPAGRRSGKTMLAKRHLVLSAMAEEEVEGARFVATAPTYAQAKRIFWRDLQALTPRWMVRKTSQSNLTIELVNSSFIEVAGMDKPERLEGTNLRGLVVDEYGNCKSNVWDEHLALALSTSNCIGWAWFIGVPEGRNHYFNLAMRARECEDGTWGYFTWHSSTILSPEEIERLRSELDPQVFKQECEGEFLSFQGRAYYNFGPENVTPLEYDPHADLVVCFDFNVSPGVAAIVQEQARGTCVIGEVWIAQNSNTPMICARIAEKWAKKHHGMVICDGDPAGGARSTSGVDGSDWDLIEGAMRRSFPGRRALGSGLEVSRVRFRQLRCAPSVRARLNAVNSRILSADGTHRLFVDPKKAPHVVQDFEGVGLTPDGSGDLLKEKGSPLTHLSDAIGYYVHRKFPVNAGDRVSIEQL